ncbi:MAG: helix-turn-helix transcriptional regulator [Bacteroidales bacterium]|nr:helix-turn-helix transcriptional regulator [Bacteroidales bacterium]
METAPYQNITLELAPLLDALSHPARLQIVLHLAKYKGCPAGNISERLPLSKSTVSQHMSKLKDVGLISCTPDGLCQNYRLNDEGFALVNAYFSNFSSIIDGLKEKRTECCPANNKKKKVCQV